MRASNRWAIFHVYPSLGVSITSFLFPYWGFVQWKCSLNAEQCFSSVTQMPHAHIKTLRAQPLTVKQHERADHCFSIFTWRSTWRRLTFPCKRTRWHGAIWLWCKSAGHFRWKRISPEIKAGPVVRQGAPARAHWAAWLLLERHRRPSPSCAGGGDHGSSSGGRDCCLTKGSTDASCFCSLKINLFPVLFRLFPVGVALILVGRLLLFFLFLIVRPHCLCICQRLRVLLYVCVCLSVSDSLEANCLFPLIQTHTQVSC